MYDMIDINEMAYFWWLRAAYSDHDVDFLSVNSDASWFYYTATTDNGFAPAFRIG